MSVSRGRQLERNSANSQGSSVGPTRSHFSRSPSPARGSRASSRKRSKSRHTRRKSSLDIKDREKETLGMLKKFLNLKISKESSAATGNPSLPPLPPFGDKGPTIEQRLEEMKLPPMGECPFIRPLTGKLVARDESLSNPLAGSQLKDSAGNTLPKRPARLPSGATKVPDLRPKTPKTPRGSGPSFDFDAANIHFRETLASDAALEQKHVQEWGYYIKCYGEGRYNTSYPPDPPPRKDGFKYLAAPTPPGDSERIMVAHKYNLPNSSGIIDRLERLAQISRKLFTAGMGAISFIDDKLEDFKAQDFTHEYTRLQPIERSSGFGAHALLSTELMIVLDTLQDWRFIEHPMVIGGNQIRFYAAVPITTYEGFAIGTLAVFDKEPRTDFPANARRKLMEMAKISMTDLEIIVDNYETSRLSSVPSLTTSDSTFSSGATRSVDDRDSFRSGGSRARILSVLEEETEIRNSLFNPDPPSRIASPDPMPEPWSNNLKPRRRSPPNLSRVGQGNNQPLHLATISSQRATLPHVQQPATLMVDRTMTASATASTTGVPTPPDSPSRINPAPRFANAAGLRIPVPDYAPLNSPTFIVTPREVLDFSEADGRYGFGYHTPEELEYASMMLNDPGTVNLGNFPGIPKAKGNNFTMRANLALKEIAEEGGYAMIYLMRLKPWQPNIPEEELLPDGLETRIIASHGLPEPYPQFEPAMHFRALCSQGGVIYQADDADDEGENDFQGGVLLPLHRDVFDENYYTSDPNEIFGEMSRSQNQPCRSGVVLAAFKSQVNEANPLDADQLRGYQAALISMLLRSRSEWA